jgi:hypothetical protein
MPERADAILKSIKSLNRPMIERFMSYVVEELKAQIADGTENEIQTIKKLTIATGVKALIQHALGSVYSNAIANKDDNKLLIFMRARNMYSSRSNNEQVAIVKNTIRWFIAKHRITKRKNTISLLTLFFALYILMLSFDTIDGKQ